MQMYKSIKIAIAIVIIIISSKTSFYGKYHFRFYSSAHLLESIQRENIILIYHLSSHYLPYVFHSPTVLTGVYKLAL